MAGLRSLFGRPLLGLAFALHFLLFANVIPWLHTCRVWVDSYANCKRPASCVSHREGDSADAWREALDSGSSLAREDLCLACLCTAQLRSLSPPAGIATLALAKAQGKLGEPTVIADLARIRVRLGARAPPTSTLS